MRAGGHDERGPLPAPAGRVRTPLPPAAAAGPRVAPGPREALRRHAALLAGVAGYVDALGYFELGRVFTANMTGNTVLLFAAGARGDWPVAAVYAATLLAFVAGALLAAALRRWRDGPFVPLLLIAVTLVALAFVRLDRIAMLAALALAMGIQAASVTRFRGERVQTVVLTGALVTLAEAVVARAWHSGAARRRRPAAPEREPPRLASIGMPMLVWTAYGLGAAAAVHAAGRVALPLVVPAAVLALTALDLVRRARRALRPPA